MAWTAPITWTQDQMVMAANFNEQLRDNLIILKVPLDDNGKIVAISSTYFASLDSSALTGLVQLNANNLMGGKNDFSGTGGRVVLPVGLLMYAI